MKQHSKIKQKQKEVVIGSVLFTISLIIGLLLFFKGLTLIGVMFFGYSALIGFLSILMVIKIQGIHTRILLLKLHNRKWSEFCECEKCVKKRNDEQIKKVGKD